MDHTIHEFLHKNIDTFLHEISRDSHSNLYIAVLLGDAACFSLPFKARAWSVGLSDAGQAYVAELKGRTVLALQLSGSGEWKELWRRTLPTDIKSNPWIAASTPATATATPLCLLHDNGYSSPTVAMDGGGEVSRTHREGRLLTCIGQRVVYGRKREDGRGYEIVLWDNDSVILRPPPDQKWGVGLSVCGMGDRVAVVHIERDRSTKTLDIFHHHQRESHSQHCQIPYDFVRK